MLDEPEICNPFKNHNQHRKVVFRDIYSSSNDSTNLNSFSNRTIVAVRMAKVYLRIYNACTLEFHFYISIGNKVA